MNTEPKSEFLTPEWVITVAVDFAMAVVAIISARGLVDPTEGALWVQLVRVAVTIVAPIIAGTVTNNYLKGRTRIKEAVIYAAVGFIPRNREV